MILFSFGNKLFLGSTNRQNVIPFDFDWKYVYNILLMIQCHFQGQMVNL